MKYKIERTEKKTTQAGKPFIKATLKDEQAQVLENVLIWADFPDFERITPGAEAEGMIRTSARGFMNLKPSQFPYPPVQVPSREQSPENRAVASYDRSHDIRAAQQRKNEAIAYFNATNSAISLISSMKSKLANPVNRTILKQEVEYWRDWFLSQWKNYESGGFNPNENHSYQG